MRVPLGHALDTGVFTHIYYRSKVWGCLSQKLISVQSDALERKRERETTLCTLCFKAVESLFFTNGCILFKGSAKKYCFVHGEQNTV